MALELFFVSARTNKRQHHHRVCWFRQGLSLTCPVFNFGETWCRACPSGRYGRARVNLGHNPIPPRPTIISAASGPGIRTVRLRLLSGGAHRLASIARTLGLSALVV